MAQYFDNVEGLGHKDITVEAKVLQQTYLLKSDLGVFAKSKLDDGTKLLLETIAPEVKGLELLDLGCGIGPIGLILAKLDPNTRVAMCDVNHRALALAIENAALLKVAGQVKIFESDVYANIDDSQFDAIISNPPIRAGKTVTYRIYDEASLHLRDGGSLYVVIRVKQGAYSALTRIQNVFQKENVRVRARKKGYLVIQATKNRS